MANRFGIRLFRSEEDIPPLVRLRVDIEAVDRAGNDTSEEGLRKTLTWRGHDPEKDRWVVEAPGEPARLVGYAYLFKQTPERVASYIAVHPAWRRQSVASDLLGQIISSGTRKNL